MRTDNRAPVSSPGDDGRMAIRRHGLPYRWLPRSNALVNYGLHIHVDIGRSVFGC